MHERLGNLARAVADCATADWLSPKLERGEGSLGRMMLSEVRKKHPEAGLSQGGSGQDSAPGRFGPNDRRTVRSESGCDRFGLR
jgi:hypothetical protein